MRGDFLRANAVRACRMQGPAACARILTIAEVHRLHALARTSGGDQARVEAGLAGAAPLLVPRLAPVPAPSVPPLRLVPPLPGPGPAAGPGLGAGVGAAGAAAIVAIVVIAGIQLWQLGRFQDELRAQGFVILENPLALCIGGCHLPSRPTRPSFPDFPSFPRTGPSTGPLTPDELDLLDRWIREQQPRGAPPQPQPTPQQPPLPEIGPLPHQRRNPNQTCPNAVLDSLQAEKDRICNSIPGESCSPSKVSPRRLARRPCSEIRRRIQAIGDCLQIRQRIQDECFGGQPDPIHQRVMNELNNGLTACLALEAQNCAPGHPMANL